MNLLALDTSTDTLSIAVQRGDAVWEHSGPGGPQTSTELIPAILALMAQAGLEFAELRAIVFGRGPGSFTGLRTACSVAGPKSPSTSSRGVVSGANEPRPSLSAACNLLTT